MWIENCYYELWTFPKSGGVLANFGLRAFRYAEILGWEPYQSRSLFWQRQPFQDILDMLIPETPIMVSRRFLVMQVQLELLQMVPEF